MTLLFQEFHRTTNVIILYGLLSEKKICRLLVHSDNLGPETGPSTHFQFATEIRVIGALGSVFLKQGRERGEKPGLGRD